MSIRCLIVDDSPRFAAEAGSLLEEEGIRVVGIATGGDEALRLARDLRPDLALVDIDLGGESGLDLTRRLFGEQDGSLVGAVILVSTHSEDEFTELIAASPAIGFLAKSELGADAIEALLGHYGQWVQ
jgi:DNA-binding NarL/FixJ family response regulator